MFLAPLVTLTGTKVTAAPPPTGTLFIGQDDVAGTILFNIAPANAITAGNSSGYLAIAANGDVSITSTFDAANPSSGVFTATFNGGVGLLTFSIVANGRSFSTQADFENLSFTNSYNKVGKVMLAWPRRDGTNGRYSWLGNAKPWTCTQSGWRLTSANLDNLAEFNGMQTSRSSTSVLNDIEIDHLKFQWGQSGQDEDFYFSLKNDSEPNLHTGGIGLYLHDCEMDGGIPPYLEGGLLSSTRSWTTPSGGTLVNPNRIEDCVFRNVVYGAVIRSSRNRIWRNKFYSIYVDGILFTNPYGHVEDILIGFNHWEGFNGMKQRYHGDFGQLNKIDNNYYYRRITLIGNTRSFGEIQTKKLLTVQADATRNFNTTVTGTGSVTLTDANANQSTAMKVATGQTLNIYLPPAASSLGRHFCMNKSNNYTGQAGQWDGTAIVHLHPGDTREGDPGPFVFTGHQQRKTFVSDGSSDWKRLRVGFHQHMLLRTWNFTLGDLEAGKICAVDASAGPIDVILDATYDFKFPDANSDGSNPGQRKHQVCRHDATNNAMRIVVINGTINFRGQQVSVINMGPGTGYYLINPTNSDTGWTVRELSGPQQGMFGNPHPNGLISNFWMIGNILQASGDFVRIEQSVDGQRTAYNLSPRYLYDDMDGDGVISDFEYAGVGSIGAIVPRGPKSCAWNNIAACNMTYLTQARGRKNLELFLNDVRSGVPAAYTTHWKGMTGQDRTTRAAWRPVTREEILDTFLAQPGGPLDPAANGGIYYGPLGTTLENGAINFVTEEVNTSLFPTPQVIDYIPTQNGVMNPLGRIDMTFDHFIEAGLSNEIEIRRTSDDVVIETFDPRTGVGTNGGTVTFYNDVISIQPGPGMVSGIGYYLQVEPGSIRDYDDRDFPGIMNKNTFKWTANSTIPAAWVRTISRTIEPVVPPATVGVTNRANLKRSSPLADIAGTGTKKGGIFAIDGRTFTGTEGNSTLLQMTSGTSTISFASFSGDLRVTLPGGSLIYDNCFPTGKDELWIFYWDSAQANAEDRLRCYRNGSEVPRTSGSLGANAAYANGASQSISLLSRPQNDYRAVLRAGFIWAHLMDNPPDMKVLANRSKFTVANMGVNGQGPLGFSPSIFFAGDATEWNAGANRGAGGAFVRAGGPFVNA